MRTRLKTKKRYKDSRAKEKARAKKAIAAALAAIAILIMAGCNEVDDIIVAVQPTDDVNIWTGELTGKLDGKEFSGDFTLIMGSTLHPDPGIPSIPDDVPTVDIVADPAAPDQVWVTPSGRKYHWLCWRTETGSGEWVSIFETSNTPCAICGDLVDAESDEDL